MKSIMEGYKDRRISLVVLLLALCLLLPSSASAGLLMQHQFTYTVARGDTIASVASRVGISEKTLGKDNGLDPAKPLRAGQNLKVFVTEIVPEIPQRGLLIDIPGSMLYLFDAGIPIMSAPVGLGKPKKDGKKGWETPAGAFTIKGKLNKPNWKVPGSIKEEMRREGRQVKESYPPGPKNPVGGYVLQTTLPGILIHDTIDPASISRFMSHGCVRLLRPDMEQLFELVTTGMAGTATYQPVKIAQQSDGKIFMEVNRDVYKKIPNMQAEARRVLKKAGLMGSVDMKKVEGVVKAANGIPEDITAKKK